MSMGFVNPVSINPAFTASLKGASQPARRQLAVDPSAAVIDPVLSAPELASLRQIMDGWDWKPVGDNGILADYRAGEPVGSWRASVYDEALAEALWARMREALPAERSFDAMARTDWDEHERWRAVGLNPLLRFIRYDNAGLLVPHYDAPYVESSERRTLVTAVIYLAYDRDVSGGSTRFVRDEQLDRPLVERDLSDWDRLADDSDIVERVAPRPGSSLVFDHRLLHDSEPISSSGGSKIILRTDVIHERA